MNYLPKILLVDDEIEFLSISTALLRSSGFDVYSLSSGHEVFPIARNFRPNIILLDVKLGHEDGRQICYQLKQAYDTKEIKVILHSAFFNLSNEYQNYGAEDFIIKPYTFETMVARMRNLLA